MPRSRFCQFAQPLDAFRTASKDRDPRSHLGILVTKREPFAQAGFGTLLAVVDGDIDALGDRKPLRIALGPVEQASQHFDLMGEIIRGRRAGAHPAVAVTDRTPETDLVARAEPDWRMGALHRLGFHRHVREAPELAVDRRAWLHP